MGTLISCCVLCQGSTLADTDINLPLLSNTANNLDVPDLNNDTNYIQLAYQMRPLIYLHSDEQYYPDAAEPYLNTLASEAKRKGAPPNQINDVPAYYHIYRPAGGYLYTEDTSINLRYCIAIHYGFFFPYSAPYKLPGGITVGGHDGDFEHITVILDQRLEVAAVFYAAHNSEGRWVTAKRLECQITKVGQTRYCRPTVYISKGSHACYPYDGSYRRPLTLGCLADETNDGTLWNINHLISMNTLTQIHPSKTLAYGTQVAWQHQSWFLAAT